VVSKDCMVTHDWPRKMARIQIPDLRSITFARAPVIGDHWRRTSNLIKSMDKNQ